MPIYRISAPPEGIPYGVKFGSPRATLLDLLGTLAAHSPTQRQYAPDEIDTFPVHDGCTILMTVRLFGTEQAAVRERSFVNTGVFTVMPDRPPTPVVYYHETEPTEIGLGRIPLAVMCQEPGDDVPRFYSLICHDYLPPLGRIPAEPR